MSSASARRANIPAASVRLRHAIEERRNAVCVAPEFPGNPDDYKYIEKCILKKQSRSPPQHKLVRIHRDDIKQAKEHLASFRGPASPASPSASANDEHILDLITRLAIQARQAKANMAETERIMATQSVLLAKVIKARTNQVSLLQRIDTAARDHGVRDVALVRTVLCGLIVGLSQG